MARSQAEKLLLAEAGELLVVSLMHHMRVASQDPRTWKADDILIHGGPSVQVKTTDQGIKHGWVLSAIDVEPTRFYAFVEYSDPLQPVVYLLPSATAERAAATADRRYYEQRPKKERPNTLLINASQFTTLDTTAQLLDWLFGPAPEIPPLLVPAR